MKIAINTTREAMGGITTTNLCLLDHLHGSEDTSFVGIELNSQRVFKSPMVYRHLSPVWFNHFIITISDYILKNILKKSVSLMAVKKEFKSIIEEIRKILRKEKPDVVLINGTYYIPWLISIAAKAEKIPVALWYAGVLSRETEHMSHHSRKILNRMEKSVVNSADQIFFPSKICKDVVYKEVCNSNMVKKGMVIANPINSIFTREKKIEEGVQRRIAFVGRYSPIKNVQEFCAIHQNLLKAGWKHEATIVSNISKAHLRKIPKTIKVIPSMSPKDIKTFYATQGLIISPSLFETFGNVPIEAACTGIPVLVNGTMGCADVLSESGLERMVVDFNDKQEVIKRVIELCGQYILPRQINNLRKRVDSEYVANEIMSVIENLK